MSDPAPSLVPRWLSGAAALSWRVIVVGVALALIGLAFVRLRIVAVPVVASLFLTTMLAPPADWLRRHRVPSLLATWVVFIAVTAAVAGIVFGVLPTLQTGFAHLGRDLGTALTKTEHWLIFGPLHVSRSQVNHTVDQAINLVNTHTQSLIRGALTGVSVATSVLAGILLTMVLTFFFVKDGKKIWAWGVSLASERRARDLNEVGRRCWTVLTGYIVGTAVNGVINAVLLVITLVILGVPLVAPLGLLTFIGAFLPLVGAFITGGIAALVALVATGPVAAAVVVAVTAVIHNLGGYMVGPYVLARAVRLHPVAVLIVLGVGTILGGIIGAFLAVPAAAVIASVIGYYRGQRSDLVVPEPPRWLGGRAGRRPAVTNGEAAASAETEVEPSPR